MKESSLTIPATCALLLCWCGALWHWPSETVTFSLALVAAVVAIYGVYAARHAGKDPTAVPEPNWYDGDLYASLVEQQLAGVHTYMMRKLLTVIDDDQQGAQGLKLLDVGCGTGAFADAAATKYDAVASVVGIDSSKPQINAARKRVSPKLSFEQGNAAYLPQFRAHEFDAAFLCMVLHEMAPEQRSAVIKEALRVAKRVVLCDFEAPMPCNSSGLRNRLMEFTAGPRHFAGFRDFQGRGGLAALVDDATNKGLASTRFNKTIDGNTVRVTILHSVS